MEIWRDVTWIPGFEGCYQVSNTEKVMSLNYRRTGKPGILQQFPSGDYLFVLFNQKGKRKDARVHQLVARAFPEICGEWFPGAVVNHKDENKHNNKPENLEWVTPKENTNWGTSIKRRAKSKERPIIQYTVSGEFVKEWDSTRTVTKATNGKWKEPNICHALSNDGKTAYGFIWKRKTEAIN